MRVREAAEGELERAGKADIPQRRQTIAEAVVRLVATKGVEAASLRAVAAEAGVSMGTVQHYFTSTDEMLLLPLDSDSRTGARLRAALIARGCVDEPTGKLAAAAYANLHNFVVRQLTEALKGHPTAAGMTVARSARHLVSVIEGLRWPLLFGGVHRG